ncbi:MAG: amino acid permease [Victivallaceae bacterium]
MSSTRGKLTVFTLTMMTVAAVISLRGLPMMAKEGLSMIFYILFATILFLLPASLVAAELGGAFSEKQGGVYTWVKAAFGSRWGFLAIWLQWIQNVFWYPTVLAFAAGSIAYIFDTPKLASSGLYTGILIIVTIWLATFLTLRGTQTIGAITKYGALLGTVIPGIFIIGLGIVWVLQGNPWALTEAISKGGEITHVHPTFFPHITGLSSVAFLAGIILLFAGVEVQAVLSSELPNPAKDFPKAIFLAMIIIFLLFLLGSLAVAMVIPASEISLTSGLMEAFRALLRKFELDFLTPVFGLLTAFGAIGGVMSWISGPSRGLLSTAKDGELPPFLAKTNANGIQTNLLFVQALIVTGLAGLYLVMTNVSVAFFMLSAMTVTLYLVMYILMYAAAIKLRYSQPDLPRSYRVPGGKPGMWIIAGLGIIGVSFALVVAFFPPSNLPVGKPALYVILVTLGLVIFGGLPLLIHQLKKPSWQSADDDDKN